MIAAALVSLALISGGDSMWEAAKCGERCQWERRLEAQPAYWQRKIRDIAECESVHFQYEHDTATGSTYHGYLQFSIRTWRAAQRYLKPRNRTRRDPHRLSWPRQAVVGIKLARHEGTGHWPVCGG